jgi:hypothetical protein
MPRINIEDEFFIDAGRVGAKLGDYDRALGMALGWIKFGQDKFKAGKKITRQEFLNRFSEALIPEFATFKGDFVEVVGADKHFSWLLKKQEAGAAGGSVSSDAKKQAAIEREKRKREARGAEEPQAEAQDHKQPEATTSEEPEAQASSSFSPSSSSLKTLAAVSPPAAPPSAKIASPGENRGTVINALSGNSRFVQVLQFVPADVQRSWIDRWTKASITATLHNGIDHYMTEAGAQSIAGVTDWGAKLTRWMRGEKKTLVEHKPSPADKPKPAASGWGTGAREVLGGATPMEAFRQRRAGAKGSA